MIHRKVYLESRHIKYKENLFMPIYFIFISIAVVIAIFSGKIDEKVNANGELRRAVTIFCIIIAILTSILIKSAL